MLTLQFSGNATTGQVKEITHGGRRYLISPVVALREGILNDTLVSAAEFGKFASSWSGRPVPISHPKAAGVPTSANTPDIWAADVLGHFWNVAVDGGALKGEIWIDLDKAQTMGERATAIVNRLRQGEPMEVSTGYFCEMEATPGTWGGNRYGGIARNIRPDHLALLPDEIGACSWADGCGTPRINERSDNVDELGLFQRFLGWLKNDQPQNLEPAAADNSPVTQENFAVVGNESNVPTQESSSMNKTELIGALVANAKCKFSQEKLATWDEGDLQVLQESLDATPPEAVSDAAPEAAPPPPDTSTALEARLARIEEMLGSVTANANEERANLIAAIVPNCRGAWSEAELRGMDIAKLRQVHSSYLPRDYSANAGTLRMVGPEEEELLMVWPEFAKKGA